MLDSKWEKLESYTFLKKLIKDNLQNDENLGINNENFQMLPKAPLLQDNAELIDLSYIDLSGLRFGKVWMGHYLDHANLSNSKFYRTHFHNAVANEVDFSDSIFEKVQFIPFIAKKSNFKNCYFKDCLAFGTGGNPKEIQSYNDFKSSKFINVKIINCDFSKSRFDEAIFENSEIKNSIFSGAIFLNTIFKNTVFKNCSFVSIFSVGGCDFITSFISSCIENAEFINCDFEGAIFDEKSDHIKV